MALVLNPGVAIGEEVQRVALEQVAKLGRRLEHPERGGIEESVHEIRTRCKKIRAIARLVRPGLGGLYRRTNEAFRDAARQFAAARDAQVMPETLDALMDALPVAVGPTDVSAARLALFAQRQQSRRGLGPRSEAFEVARTLVAEGADLIAGWEVEDDFEVLAGGFARTHRRFGDAWLGAREEPTVAAFHEWRKRAKYHRYHLRLLSGAYPSLMDPWTDEVHRLTDSLGDDHDLAVLTRRVRERPALVGGDDQAEVIIVLGEGRSASLRDGALSLGARLAAEDTDAVLDRLRTWWAAARKSGPEPRRVALADFP